MPNAAGCHDPSPAQWGSSQLDFGSGIRIGIDFRRRNPIRIPCSEGKPASESGGGIRFGFRKRMHRTAGCAGSGRRCQRRRRRRRRRHPFMTAVAWRWKRTRTCPRASRRSHLVFLLDKLVSAVFRFEEKALAPVLSKSANFKSAPRSAGFQLLALVQRAVQKNGLCPCCQELCAPRQERARASEWCRRRLC